jgi:hypothetical protein
MTCKDYCKREKLSIIVWVTCCSVLLILSLCLTALTVSEDSWKKGNCTVLDNWIEKEDDEYHAYVLYEDEGGLVDTYEYDTEIYKTRIMTEQYVIGSVTFCLIKGDSIRKEPSDVDRFLPMSITCFCLFFLTSCCGFFSELVREKKTLCYSPSSEV